MTSENFFFLCANKEMKMSQVCAEYACEAVTQTDLKKLKKLCAYKFLVAREGADWRVCVVWGL